MVIEQTLIVLKPDGFKRQLVGKILARFEEKGLQIKNIRSYEFSEEKAKEFYSVHRGKPFFSELVSFITSGLVVACILEGNNAIRAVRSMVGIHKLLMMLSAGTVRGDFGLGITDNLIHASDSSESFIKESQVIFNSS